MPSSASGRLSINLQSLKKNYKLIRAQVGRQCEVAAVVKANGYGLGQEQVARTFHEAGCSTFFVATLGEALMLRQSLPETTIAVLNGLLHGAEKEYRAHDLIPVIGSIEALERYAGAGEKRPLILHIDTGMNRLGFSADEFQTLLRKPDLLAPFNLHLIMSHFACSDEAHNPMNDLQFKNFEEASAHFSGIKKSLCNSSGIFRSKEYHMGLVRPGACLYGVNPTPETDNPMNAVVTLQVPVQEVYTAISGESAGYGATYRFDKNTPLATVSLGYADGFSRALGNKSMLYWKEYKCPVRGRVSMDLTIVDLSEIPEKERPLPGDFIEVIGQHQTLDDLAMAAGTIGYEILTSLGQRYERLYT